MVKVLDIVTRAHRKLNIAGQGEALEGEAAIEGLGALNMMMHGWQSQGIGRPHFEVELNDDFPMDPRFQEGVVYLLAERISDEYRKPPTFSADEFLRDLMNAYMVIDEIELESGLTYLPSKRDFVSYGTN